MAREIEDEAKSIIDSLKIGESGEFPLAFYPFTASGGPRGRAHTTVYVIQISGFAYAQKVKNNPNAPPPDYCDLRIDIRAKTTLNADRGADRSNLQEGGYKFANNGYIVSNHN